ncbi:MAG: hypothetical protein AAGG01_20780, partial [Planctomycetota bacterium]
MRNEADMKASPGSQASDRPSRRSRTRSAIASLLLAAPCVSCGESGDVAPWEGTLKSGVVAMAERAQAGEVDEALAVAERMLAPGGAGRLRSRLDGWTRGASETLLQPLSTVLDAVGVSTLRPEDQAEIEYARSAALLMGASRAEEDAPGLLERAQTALEKTRAAAPGGAREDAVYNLGTLDLMAAEAVRATLPEVSGQQQGPPQQGPQSPPDPNAAEEPDPLDVARAGYLAAREHFVERLGLGDADDERRYDTAANVELCLRRLRELDEIEKQREQQKQEQDQSEDGEEGEQDDSQESEKDEEKDDSDKKPEDGERSDEQDPEKQDPGEDPPEDDPSEEPQEEEPEDDPEEQDPEENPSEEEGESDEEPEEQEADPKEG